MPYKQEWVPNELVLEHVNSRVRIYRAYNDDNYGDPLSCWFNLHDGMEEDSEPFDYRHLPCWQADKSLTAEEALLRAIDLGEITQEHAKQV